MSMKLAAAKSLQDILPHGEPKPFKISLPSQDINELKSRLDTTRWGPQGGVLPDDDPNVNAGLLPTPQKVLELGKRWLGFDFSKLEAQLNQHESFLVDIGWCKPLHYVHKKSSRKDAIPLIIVHGWPTSFFEMFPLIEKLAEPENADDPAFHVVVPSVPGTMYSKGPPNRQQGVGDTDGYCHIFDTLMMGVLGYKSYVAQGGDWGSAHARTLGAKFARQDGKTGCRAVHLNFSPIVPPGGHVLSGLGLSGPVGKAASMLPFNESKNLSKMIGFQNNMAYYIIQQNRPQQLGYALTDSPTGLLAWIAYFYCYHIEGPAASDITDPKRIDYLLALCTLYYVTRSVSTSVLPYHNNRLITEIHGDPAYRVHNGATLGYTNFPEELINMTPYWIGKSGDLRFYADAPSGGHFACADEPDMFANHLRVAFSPPRNNSARSNGLLSYLPGVPFLGGKDKTLGGKTVASRLTDVDRQARGISACSVPGTLWTPALPTGGGKA